MKKLLIPCLLGSTTLVTFVSAQSVLLFDASQNIHSASGANPTASDETAVDWNGDTTPDAIRYTPYSSYTLGDTNGGLTFTAGAAAIDFGATTTSTVAAVAIRGNETTLYNSVQQTDPIRLQGVAGPRDAFGGAVLFSTSSPVAISSVDQLFTVVRSTANYSAVFDGPGASFSLRWVVESNNTTFLSSQSFGLSAIPTNGSYALISSSTPLSSMTWAAHNFASGVLGLNANPSSFSAESFGSGITKIGIYFNWTEESASGGTNPTFDIAQVGFNAIPESSTFGSLAGLGVIAFTASRRRRRS
jgi:hypothetical protein